MTFQRNIYSEFLKWKQESAGETALLIEGARRVGKSTIAEEFAKNEYKSYIRIDFNDASQIVRDAFFNYLNDLDLFFMVLSTEYNVTLYRGESLIIFDEIQQFPKARQSIKRLIQDGRYHYMETGSLISIRDNVKDITIPSEERHIKMYPMDFAEFSLALGEEMLLTYIKDCFTQRKPLDEGLHHKAMLLFRQYMLVGGMPRAVAAYMESDRSFLKADRIKRDILSLYKDDIGKIDRKYRAKVSSIFEQIPAFLSMHEKRIRLSNVESGTTYPMYEDTFFWLGDSMIVNECFRCNDPNVGLSMNEDRAALKCYMGDTGLLVSHSFSPRELDDGKLYKEILHDNLAINEGMLFENAVAQCLTSSGYPLYFYTHYDEGKKRNDIEIDFVIGSDSKLNPKIFPIEVKGTKRYQTVSLNKFVEKYRKRIGQAYVIHTKNLQVTEEILYLPAYMAWLV